MTWMPTDPSEMSRTIQQMCEFSGDSFCSTFVAICAGVEMPEDGVIFVKDQQTPTTCQTVHYYNVCQKWNIATVL